MDAEQGCEPSRRILRKDIACGLQLPAFHSFCKAVSSLLWVCLGKHPPATACEFWGAFIKFQGAL